MLCLHPFSDSQRYGNSGNASPLCGKKVHITNQQNGKSVTVTVADDCPTCLNSDSIDLSQGAFDSIADEATGIVPSEHRMSFSSTTCKLMLL